MPSLTAALLLLLTAGAVRSDPVRLLRAAERADQRLSYTGTRVVQASDDEANTERRVRVWHLAPDRTRTEYLSPDSGSFLLVRGADHWIYSARRGQWRSVSWRSSPSSLDLLVRNYRVRQRGRDTVAGRPVIQIAIEPRHPGNPEKLVWIDPACRMVLREEVRNYDGQVVASSRFEQFERVHELPAALFEAPAAPVADRGSPELPFAAVRPRYLPAGYEEVRLSALRRGPGAGVVLRYTDGLGAISLFEFRAESGREPGERDREEREGRREERKEGERHQESENDGPRGRPERRGAGPARLTRKVGDLFCRVMGDIAPGELRRLLDSLPERP